MGNQRKIDGRALNVAKMNLALYGKMDPDAPRDDQKRIPLIKDGKPIGTIVVIGTGEKEGNYDFKSLWEESVI